MQFQVSAVVCPAYQKCFGMSHLPVITHLIPELNANRRRTLIADACPPIKPLMNLQQLHVVLTLLEDTLHNVFYGGGSLFSI